MGINKQYLFLMTHISSTNFRQSSDHVKINVQILKRLLIELA